MYVFFKKKKLSYSLRGDSFYLSTRVTVENLINPSGDLPSIILANSSTFNPIQNQESPAGGGSSRGVLLKVDEGRTFLAHCIFKLRVRHFGILENKKHLY
jgi:hypothetical protein